MVFAGCVSLGGSKMSVCSDLRNADYQRIVLLRALDKEEAISRAAFHGIYERVVRGQDLTHVGFLYCRHDGVPTLLSPDCGGIIQFQRQEGRDEAEMICSKCKMRLRFVSFANFPTVFHSLMLKQIVPGMASCNYIDCVAKGILGTERGKIYQARIKALGLISVFSECLWGYASTEFFPARDDFRPVYSLGFMLRPGINPSAGGDELFEWLQFLVCQGQERIKRLVRDELPFSLFGPRQEY